MTSKRPIVGAKALVMLGFLVLLSTTYTLRGEALTLSRIGFSADKAKADLDEARRGQLIRSVSRRMKSP